MSERAWSRELVTSREMLGNEATVFLSLWLNWWHDAFVRRSEQNRTGWWVTPSPVRRFGEKVSDGV